MSELAAERNETWSVPGNRTAAIFLISVLGLFLEMMLIRWIATEIRIFAYLQNTVLIVCFLGLGVGCFTSQKPIRVRHMLIALLTLSVLLAVPLTREILQRITMLLAVFGEMGIWAHEEGAESGAALGYAAMGLVLTLALMVLLWEIFLPMGRILGRQMHEHPRTIWAYSANIAGSLAGIWLFVLTSAFSLPPAVWMILAAVIMFWFIGRGAQKLLNLALLGGVVAAGALASHDPTADEVAWSPYQKLVRRQLTGRETDFPTQAGQMITVNNANYQAMIDLDRQRVEKNPSIGAAWKGMSQYDFPLRFKPRPEHALIVGAGSGNDVAGALRGGAKRVTAVEIDPAIISMGRRHHPERPYQSPRVRVVNDDARSFFATTDEKYDLIIFGLLDSHTTTAMTNARLDHYVYTRESLTRARSLLADGGVMFLSFEAAKPYIADRMAASIRDVFGKEALTFRMPPNPTGWGGVAFVAGDGDAVAGALAADQTLAARVEEFQRTHPVEISGATRTATDDWPYIYLESPRIPMLYLLLAGMMLGLVGYGWFRTRTSPVAGWGRSHWHFFFLGAAFLLLEVQNISKASVVLGNTWQVNAVIISGIMLMILLANLIAAFAPNIPRWLTGGGLAATCLILYFVDLAQFAFLPYATKALIVGSLTTLPMLFSGIIFIQSFRQVARKDTALGANLVGAIAGAMLQSVTFLIGIKALLLVVAGLYLIALFTAPREAAARDDSDDTPRKRDAVRPRAEEEATERVEEQPLEPAGV